MEKLLLPGIWFIFIIYCRLYFLVEKIKHQHNNNKHATCNVHIVQCTLYNVQCTGYTLYTIQGLPYNVYYTSDSVQCTLYIVQCI